MSPLPGKSLLPKFPASAGAMARRPEVLPAPSARGQKCSTATKGPTWAETPAACRPVQRDVVRDPRVGCLSSLQPNGWASPTLQEFSCQVQVQWNFSTRDPSTWDLSSQGAPHFSDTLKTCFCEKLGQISSNITMSILCYFS